MRKERGGGEHKMGHGEQKKNWNFLAVKGMKSRRNVRMRPQLQRRGIKGNTQYTIYIYIIYTYVFTFI